MSGEILILKYEYRTGRIRGLIQKVPSLPKGRFPVNRKLPYVCRENFQYGNIQSSQNCFLVFSKMAELTFLSKVLFLTFFVQKLVIHSSFLSTNLRIVKSDKKHVQNLKLPDSWERYFCKFKKFTKIL